MGEYWRHVHQRAYRDALSALRVETWGRIMKGVWFVACIMGALYIFGSPDAWRDEIVGRGALLAAILLAFPLIYLWYFIKTPALLSAEEKSSSSQRLIGLESRLSELEGRSNLTPTPEFNIISSYDSVMFNIDNHTVDAVFCIKLDLSKSNILRAPSYPVFGQWEDMETGDVRRIEANTSNRVVLFRTETHSMIPSRQMRLCWVSGGQKYSQHSNSWIVAKDYGGTVPPQGKIRVIVSSDPPMACGSQIYNIEFMADEVHIY